MRGEVNGAIDGAFHEVSRRPSFQRREEKKTDLLLQSSGKAKNDAVAREGYGEISTGHFAPGTKNREGAIPGDKERRY